MRVATPCPSNSGKVKHVVSTLFSIGDFKYAYASATQICVSILAELLMSFKNPVLEKHCFNLILVSVPLYFRQSILCLRIMTDYVGFI